MAKKHKCLPFKYEVGQRVQHKASFANPYFIIKRSLIQDETGIRLVYALLKAPGEMFLAQEIELDPYMPRVVEDDNVD